jgi:hypothetical protein
MTSIFGVTAFLQEDENGLVPTMHSMETIIDSLNQINEILYTDTVVLYVFSTFQPSPIS